MWQACQGIVATPMKTTNMPTSADVRATYVSAQLPTHMLAICQSSQAQAALKNHTPIRYQLVPTHNIVLAAHCANLRPLTTKDQPASRPAAPGGELTLPVQRMVVPHRASFAAVHECLYTKNVEKFAASMIPTSTARSAPGSAPPNAAGWASRLAGTFTREVLVRHLEHTLGVWQNMCYLGIQDDAMWHALQASWYTIRGAVVLQARRAAQA